MAKREKKTLKQLREENRYTIQEVADGSGLTMGTYKALEYGYRKCNVDNAQKLADFYSLMIEDIEFVYNGPKGE